VLAANLNSCFMITMLLSWYITQQRLVYSCCSSVNSLLFLFSPPKWETSSEARCEWPEDREWLVNRLHPKWMQLLHLFVSEVNLFFSKNIVHLPVCSSLVFFNHSNNYKFYAIH